MASSQQDPIGRLVTDDPDSIDHPLKQCCRDYYFKISGSLAKFAANPRAASTRICADDASSIQYRPFHSQPGSKRFGRPQEATVFGAQLLWIVNTLPTTVLLQSNSFRGFVYCAGGQRGLLTVPPSKHGLQCLHAPYPITTTSHSVYSPVAQNYAQYSKESITAGCRPWVNPRSGESGEHWAIDPTSAAFRVLVLNQKNQEKEYSMDSFKTMIGEDEVYVIPRWLYESVQTALLQQVIPQLPHTNLMEAEFSIVRAGENNFSASFGVYTNSRENIDALWQNASGEVHGQVRLTFRLPGIPDCE